MRHEFKNLRLLNELMGISMVINYDSYSIVIRNAQFMDEKHTEFIHSHNFHEFYYVLSGSLVMHCQGEEIELSENNIFYTSPNVEHYGEVKSHSKNERFIVAFEIINNATSDHALTASEYCFQEMSDLLKQFTSYWEGKDINNVSMILDSICDEIIQSKPLYFINIQNHISTIIINLIQNMTNLNSSGVDEYLDYVNRPILITKYIHEHITEKITLEMIAEYFHTTPRHVNRLFKQYFNASFGKSLKKIRLGYVKRYLNSEYSIEKITELTGFSSVCTLYKDFSELEGMRMSEYRDLHQKVAPQEKVTL